VLVLLGLVLLGLLWWSEFQVTFAVMIYAFLLWDGIVSTVGHRWSTALGERIKIVAATLPFAAASATFAALWAVDGSIGAALYWMTVSLIYGFLGWANFAIRGARDGLVELSESGMAVKDLLFRRSYRFDEIADVRPEIPSRLPFLNGPMRTTVLVRLKSTTRPIAFRFRSIHLRIPEADVERFLADFNQRLSASGTPTRSS